MQARCKAVLFWLFSALMRRSFLFSNNFPVMSENPCLKKIGIAKVLTTNFQDFNNFSYHSTAQHRHLKIIYLAARCSAVSSESDTTSVTTMSYEISKETSCIETEFYVISRDLLINQMCNRCSRFVSENFLIHARFP